LATHVSARKRARQAEKRRIRNRHVRSGVKSVLKSARAALDGKSSEIASEIRQAESVIRRAASKGVLTKKQASRKVSRLARRAHKLAAAK
jgi:small subunit ribosomal protein S20